MYSTHSRLNMLLRPLILPMPSINTDVGGVSNRVAHKICADVEVARLPSPGIHLHSCALFANVCVFFLSSLLLQVQMPPFFDDVASSRRPLQTRIPQQHVHINAHFTRCVIAFAPHEPCFFVQVICIECVLKNAKARLAFCTAATMIKNENKFCANTENNTL